MELKKFALWSFSFVIMVLILTEFSMWLSLSVLFLFIILCGYSRLKTCREDHEPMDIDLPPDWLKYDEYADSEFLIYFSDVDDNEYWRYRLQLKFGREQQNVHNDTFRQQFIKTFLDFVSLSNVRDDVLYWIYQHADEESKKAIDRELHHRSDLVDRFNRPIC